MVTLLLCFFVLLNTMSTVNADKFKQLVSNLTGNPYIFELLDNAANIGQTGLEKAPEIPEGEYSDPTDSWMITAGEMQDAIDKFLGGLTEGEGTGDKNLIVTLKVTEATITIRCQGELLFDTLSDTLRTDGVKSLEFIVKELIMPPWDRDEVSEVRIEGHADNRPIRGGTSKFKDNLELSGFRAMAAYRYIVGNYDIPAKNVSYAGYGDTHPLEQWAGETSNDWWSRCRRVEFVLQRDFQLDKETGEGYTPA